jgi:hypothetical protein
MLPDLRVQETDRPSSTILTWIVSGAFLAPCPSPNSRRRAQRVLRAALLTLGLVVASGEAGAVSAPDDDTTSLPCRPTIACTADIVKPGLFELEAGMLFRHLDGTRQWTFPFLAKLTLTSFMQLQVGSNGYTTQFDGVPARYFDNVSPGIKFHFLDQGSVLPSLSISGAVGVPILEHQQGFIPANDAFFIAYITKDFGPIHADLNLGANDWALDSSPRAQEWVALAVSAPLPPPFGAMVEFYYFTDAAPFAGRDGGWLFALSVSPRPWLIFDFGGDIGYFPSSRAYSSFVGMTIVPVKLWP